MVSVIPYLDDIGLDFLNTDCMLENPLLSNAEKCICARVKYPLEVNLNYSNLPSYITNSSEVFNVYVLRNVTKFDSKFDIFKFINFASSNGGKYPLACNEIPGQDSAIYKYDEFFMPDKMSSILNKSENSWTFGW